MKGSQACIFSTPRPCSSNLNFTGSEGVVLAFYEIYQELLMKTPPSGSLNDGQRFPSFLLQADQKGRLQKSFYE